MEEQEGKGSVINQKMKGRTKKTALFKCWFLYLIKVVTIKLKFKMVKTIATR